MKMNYTFPVVLLIASVIFFLGTADTKEAVVDTKNPVPSKPNGIQDGINGTVEPVKMGKAGNLNKSDSKEQLESKGGENEHKKAGEGAQKDEPKASKELNLESKKEPKEERSLPVRGKCDSWSNSCMDDDKTLVACLRVPGNESPDLSLLIQNKGKVLLRVTISAPDSVQLEKKQIELQGNKDTEVTVSIGGVESGHFIVLTAGHGNCSLDFTDQFVGRKKFDHTSDSSYFNVFSLTSSTGFLFLAVLLIAAASVFMCTKLGSKYFARKDPKYQKLDMELPVSHDNKLKQDGNEGWDDSWGDSWDDEEAPKTPSLPTTPSLSSKGISSRKISKDGWKD